MVQKPVSVRVAVVGRLPGTATLPICRRLDPALLAREPWDAADVLLLCDEALRSLDPRATAVALGSGQRRGDIGAARPVVALVPQATSYETVAAWVAAGFTRVVAAPDVRALVEEIGRCARSYDAALGDLELPAQPRELGLRVVRALEAGPATRPGELARRLGWSRHRLRRVCLCELGVSPNELLRRRLVAAVRRLRAEGASIDDVAARLGYSEASALSRAVRRTGATMPPRGAGSGPRDVSPVAAPAVMVTRPRET